MSCSSNKNKTKWLPLILVFSVVLSGHAGTRSAAPRPDMYISFDDGLEGKEGYKTVSPVNSTEISAINGVRGKAILTGTKGVGENAGYIQYAAGEIFAKEAGTFMFWMAPFAAGRHPLPYCNLFSAYAGSTGGQRIHLSLGSDLICKADLQDQDGELQLRRRHLGDFWPPGDWRHFAFSWNKKGEAKLYIDGLPYQHGQANEYLRVKRETHQGALALQDIESFIFGSSSEDPRASQMGVAFDEFKGFKRVLTDKEVSIEYRRVAPVDLSIRRRFIRAGEPAIIEMNIWPGGSREVPQTGVKVATPFTLEATLIFSSAEDKILKKQKIRKLINGRQTAGLDVGVLPEGAYNLTCRYSFRGANYQKTFSLEAYRQQPVPEVSNEPLKLGNSIYRIDCSKGGHGYVDDGQAIVKYSKIGPYREAGEKRKNRFSYEIEFPQTNGSPVVLEITWPDDRPRSMGLYMYAHSLSLNQHRDRLEGGIQSGSEYPCSGSMKTVRYIFYPWMKSYLFEARTMMEGYPAAVSRIEVFPVIGRLPKLPILLPKGEPLRLFGHMDEDQTFQVMMDWEPKERLKGKNYTVDVMETLLDYLDYTGQNTMSYPLIRYRYVYQDLPGTYDRLGLTTKGWQHLMLDMFERRGKKLIAACNAWGIPDDFLAPDLVGREYALHTRDGSVATVRGGVCVNPAHPEGRRRFLRHIKDVVGDIGSHPAFAGIDLWGLPGKSPWMFGDLDFGYGDFTVHLFEQESGIHLGVRNSSPKRFERRYRLLTGKYRGKWLKWRAEKTTCLIGQIDKILREVRPDATLYVSLGGWGLKETLNHSDEESFDFRTLFYEDYGVDMKALARFPSVCLAAQRQPSWYRLQKHKNGEESTTNEIMWDPDKFSAFRNTGKAASWSYLRYFESFSGSLKNDAFKTYFQNADVKPHGRYFLQELVQSLASTDAQALLVGAQPMGMAGRDAQAREFARAYRALPAKAFVDVPGSQDPVIVRYLPTLDGVYLYAANLNFFSGTGTVSFTEIPDTAVDLSTGEAMGLSNGVLSIALKPFELRSFRFDSEAFPEQWTVHVSPQAKEWYQNKIATIKTETKKLDGSMGDDYGRLTQQIQSAVDRTEFATAHRLLFSKRIRLLPQLLEQSRKGYLKKNDAMNKRGRYAVNCGSIGFTELASGKLFAPDQKYHPGGYGFDGTHNSSARPVANLKGKELAPLYATEAYNIQAYRFTVPNGYFRVRIYLKHGYRSSAKPGVSALGITLEGREVMKGLDLFSEAGCDFDQPLMFEYAGIGVTDGVLDIGFFNGKKTPPSTRLCNAIEIIPEE